MAGFFRGFITKFASLTHPLYWLLQEDISFYFGVEELETFEQLKRVLLHSPFLAFFYTDASIRTILMTDASGVGLGATLSQVQDGKEKPVYFISRKLHANETAFSSSELETLAVVWAVERLHQYLYGRHFEIRTNHSALKEVLTGGRKNSVAPARISRWAARLLPYSFKVHYIKGCSNVVADCLSRLPSEFCGNFFDFNINIATIHGDMPPCMTMMELSHATAEDPILQRVIKYTLTKWPISVDSESQPYFRFRDEFSTDSGLLLRGDKIVVPTSIQQRLLHFAHENHFGISKSKARLRRSYWWLGMDKDVEKLVHHCFCCQVELLDISSLHMIGVFL